MGAFAGALAGIGEKIAKENLQKTAVQLHAYEEMASQYEKMASEAHPEFAKKLLEAAFQIRSTPPGKKPPKEATDLHGLMSREIEGKIKAGEAGVELPPPPRKPPGPAGETSMAQAQSQAPPNPFSMAPARGPSSQSPGPIPQFGQPTFGNVAPPLPAPPVAVNMQPGSGAPSPVSPFPSPGFGPSSAAGPAGPGPRGLPAPPLRKPNQYTQDGKTFEYYRDIPYNDDEKRQAGIADMEALAAEARSLGLTTPEDVANFIRNKEVHGSSGAWASAGQGVIYNSRTGEFKQIQGDSDLMKLGPGDTVIDKSGKVVFTAPAAAVKPTGVFGNVQQKLESELGRELTSQESIELQHKLQAGSEAVVPVVEGGRVIYKLRNQAIGKDAPRTIYNEGGIPTTGGREGLSLQRPPTITAGAQEQLTGLKNSIDQFKKVDELLQDPRYATKGPGLGQITMLQFKQGGGAGLTPEEREMATRLSTLLTTQAFQNGGKQLTGTELTRFIENTPVEGDTIANAITKTKIALEVLTNNYNNRRSMLGAQANQIPGLSGGADGGIPPPPTSRVKVRNKQTGQTGTVSREVLEANPDKYEEMNSAR